MTCIIIFFFPTRGIFVHGSGMQKLRRSTVLGWSVSPVRGRRERTHAYSCSCSWRFTLTRVQTQSRLPSFPTSHKHTTCTHTDGKAAQSINIFTLQTFTFQVNHPLFIRCQYSSLPAPTFPTSSGVFCAFPSSPGDSSSFSDLNSNHITASKNFCFKQKQTPSLFIKKNQQMNSSIAGDFMLRVVGCTGGQNNCKYWHG